MDKRTRGVQYNKRKRINKKMRFQYEDPIILYNEEEQSTSSRTMRNLMSSQMMRVFDRP
jgi:hypothetical protein